MTHRNRAHAILSHDILEILEWPIRFSRNRRPWNIYILFRGIRRPILSFPSCQKSSYILLFPNRSILVFELLVKLYFDSLVTGFQKVLANFLKIIFNRRYICMLFSICLLFSTTLYIYTFDYLSLLNVKFCSVYKVQKGKCIFNLLVTCFVLSKRKRIATSKNI